MNLLDSFQSILPKLCFITDDPFRVKMIAAHSLDHVEIFTETRGQIGLTGSFNHVPIVVLSAGIGKTSTMAYLTELISKNQLKRVVYFGDCITSNPSLPIGSIMLISKAYENGKCYDASEKLLQYTEAILRETDMKVHNCATTTDDYYLIDKTYRISQESKVLDFTSAPIYRLNDALEVLSVLTVCENISTNDAIGEAVRQSGNHSAILLALQILSFDAKILQ
jgi:purine-nucleoside phosphorylase